MVYCSIYHVFLEKNEFAKLCITSGFELTISCRLQGRTDHCTTSVDTGLCLCTLSVCLILHCGEYRDGTWRLVSDIRRGARRATRSGHDVTGMGLPVHLDSPGPDSEVLALRLPGRRSATGLEAGAAISACGLAQCHASSESDSRHKPFKTRFDAIAKQNKTICEPAGRFLNYKKPLLLILKR